MLHNFRKEVSTLVLELYKAPTESTFFLRKFCAWEAMLHKLAALKFVRSLLSNSSTMAPNMPVQGSGFGV